MQNANFYDRQITCDSLGGFDAAQIVKYLLFREYWKRRTLRHTFVTLIKLDKTVLFINLVTYEYKCPVLRTERFRAGFARFKFTLFFEFYNGLSLTDLGCTCGKAGLNILRYVLRELLP